MLHQLGESGLCHLGIAPYLGIACDFPKEMKCFAMMSDEFDHFLGIVDRRGENVRVPIEEALDRLDLDLLVSLQTFFMKLPRECAGQM